MHSWIFVSGKAVLMASGKPLRPSTQAIRMSLTPRFCSSVSTLSQNLAPSFSVVIARLTFNPWLFTYPTDIHWSLWTYGGATLFCALAAWRTDNSPALRRWLEAAALHLLVLTL